MAANQTADNRYPCFVSGIQFPPPLEDTPTPFDYSVMRPPAATISPSQEESPPLLDDFVMVTINFGKIFN